jgi:hypothetical protein
MVAIVIALGLVASVGIITFTPWHQHGVKVIAWQKRLVRQSRTEV